MMQAMLILLPALAAVCYGAALPQSLATGPIITPTGSATEPSWTLVVPCFPGEPDCSVRTVTVEGRDTPEPTFGFGLPSESVVFGADVTQTALIVPRQSLVTGTTIAIPEETFSFVIPCYSAESSCVPRTVTLGVRDPEPQSLVGTISRSASIPPTLPTTTSHHHHHWWPKREPEPQSLVGTISRSASIPPTLPTTTPHPSHHHHHWWWPLGQRDPEPQSLGSVSRSASILPTLPTITRSPHHHHWWPREKRDPEPQVSFAGVPSRSVPHWPYATKTITVTITTTVLPPSSISTSSALSLDTDSDTSSTYTINTSASTGVLTARQVLGSPTRTVLDWPYPTVTVTTTVYVSAPSGWIPPPADSTTTLLLETVPAS